LVGPQGAPAPMEAPAPQVNLPRTGSQAQAQAPAEAAPLPPTSPRGSITLGLPKPTQDAYGRIQKHLAMLPEAIEKGTQIRSQIAGMKDAVANLKTGALLPVAKEIAGILQSAGILSEAEANKMSGGNLPDAQVFEKLANQSSMGIVRDALGGQGKVTGMEFEVFRRSNPNLATTKPGIIAMLNFFDKLASFPAMEQRFYNNSLKKWQEDRLLHGGVPKDRFPLQDVDTNWAKIAMEQLPGLSISTKTEGLQGQKKAAGAK
jgi:hypothetical protein